MLVQWHAHEPCGLEGSHTARLSRFRLKQGPLWLLGGTHGHLLRLFVLSLCFFLTYSLWSFTLGRVMVVADCCWSFQTDFYLPQCFWPCPILDTAINYVPSSHLAPAFVLFSLPLPQSLRCLAYVFHLPGMGSTATQWAQKLINDWCNRILNLTSWCSHALNINKGHAFGWTCGVLFESTSEETSVLLRTGVTSAKNLWNTRKTYCSLLTCCFENFPQCLATHSSRSSCKCQKWKIHYEYLERDL